MASADISQHLPPLQSGSAVWKAADLEESDWQATFSDAELAQLADAADAVLAASPDSSSGPISLSAVDKEAASLVDTALGARVRQILDSTLLHGRGFVLLRGLPIASWGRPRAAAAFLVISRVLGPLRKQVCLGQGPRLVLSN
jgi:hypothetical protein